jgi:tetratricopeptide (TPR) repeat protein
MKCNRIEKYLYTCSDVHADPAQDAEVRAHLVSCRRCTRLFACLQAMREGLANTPEVAVIPPHEIDAIVAECLRRQSPVSQENRRQWFALLSGPKIAYAVAALAMMAAAIIFVPILRPKHDGTSMVSVLKGSDNVAAGCVSTSAVAAHGGNGYSASCAETGIGTVPAVAGHLRQNLAGSCDSAALHQYAIAENMMGKGRYAPAAHVLEIYVTKYESNVDSVWFDLGYCYTVLRRYNDAVDAYRRVADESADGPLIETALHRINKIRYLKLAQYEEARRGIEEYLVRFPAGTWREEALYYCIKIALAEKDLNKANGTLKRLTAEFPRNCKVAELTAEIEALAQRISKVSR